MSDIHVLRPLDVIRDALDAFDRENKRLKSRCMAGRSPIQRYETKKQRNRHYSAASASVNLPVYLAMAVPGRARPGR